MYILTSTKNYTDTHAIHNNKIAKEFSYLKTSSIVFSFILLWRFPATMLRHFLRITGLLLLKKWIICHSLYSIAPLMAFSPSV